MKIVTFTVKVDNDDYTHAIEDAIEAIGHANIKRGKVIKGNAIKIEVKEPYIPKPKPTHTIKRWKK